nr:hypothetical protein [Tanacetum cinerariifolium]
MFDCDDYLSSESDESWPSSSLYDRFQPSNGYHAVPLPYTGTIMPPKPDLVFNIAPSAVETDHPAFNVQLSPTKPEQDLSYTNRPATPIIEDWISDSEDQSETKAPQIVLSFFQSTEQVKSLRHSVHHVETSIPVATPKPTSPKPASSGKKRNRKACFVCKSLDHLIKDCDYHAKKMVQPTPRNHAHRENHKKYAPLTHQYPQKRMVPAALLNQSKPVSITAVRPVSAVVPKIKVTRPRHVKPIVTQINSPIRRYLTRSPSSTVSNSPPRVTAVKALVVNVAHGNMSYLSNFKELNGGYVAFGGNLKGGKISRKGKIKTGKLDFDDVYFPDESQVLLRVPRENNMYNVNLKNIIPSGDLTCLFAKATIDESNLWHRRPRHINFKTMNKLVKGNLVRGLPIKVFENDNTCVACKKGKQHRASCKTKPVSSVDQPLYKLYIDLFGPTFVKSLNKEIYCLVVTDDYSRFTWVFFLDTKDETSPILKTFITGLENQLCLKVKVIRSDNGTNLRIMTSEKRTLIEAARTMLADSLLPIPFWAEAVNTACYVQNRVLVTKPHNKTPYELLNGRTPSIGFMRPFGCPVTILSTLGSLGKFNGKVDEGFLVGYSVSSKAFRVFNNRTHIVQEILHVNFLENKTNVAGSGPTWLFDIDSLTRTMNYQPVTVRNQTNPSSGFQDKFDAEKAGEEIDQRYVLFLVWSSGSINPQNNDVDAAFDGKEPDIDVKKIESEVNVSPSSSAQSWKQDDKTKKEAKGKSPIESFTRYRDLSLEFKDYSDNNINEVNAADASQFLDDPDMPGLEDITHSDDKDDVGAETNFNNLETSITVSPIPTIRVHKYHPVSQIISDLSLTTQTRSMTRVVKDQDGLSQMFNADFYTCMFACFLSQEEPKRVHQALKDPSWIEAMQEELLQFKMQKVWVLVDFPYGKRAIGTKWGFRNKMDEKGIVIRNKARLFTQGHILLGLSFPSHI